MKWQWKTSGKVIEYGQFLNAGARNPFQKPAVGTGHRLTPLI